MVNRGRSAGCLTCKQRRVKCDELKPACGACRRLKLRCQGYARPSGYAKLKFRDENHKFATDTNQRVDAGCNGDVSEASTILRRSHASCSQLCDFNSTITLRRISEPDTAVLFYLSNYASAGRDMCSTRGFFEMLIPTYFAQPQDSALTLAVSVLASAVLSMWRNDPSGFCTPQVSYTRAIKRLRVATQDPVERSQSATALAALALQTYENAAAVFVLRPASNIHHCGAASLLPSLDTQGTEGTVRTYLRKFMLHTEVSSAIRQRKPLRDITYSYIESKDTPSVSENPSSALDTIGILVAELQSWYLQINMRDFSKAPLKYITWKAKLKDVDTQLLAWAENVPDHWRPATLVSGRGFDSSIPSFQNMCHVYPSCQIASIWNLWRFHRILLMKMMLGSLDASSCSACLDAAGESALSQAKDFVNSQATLRGMVDDVCLSIPFYLGNRATGSTLTDFTDPSLLLPIDRSIGNATPPDGYCPNAGVSRDEHRRDVIAQGPWRAMHPLSSLLTLFSEDDDNKVTSLLRPGQQKWVCQQFERVATVLRLQSRSDNQVKRSVDLEEGTYTSVETLARDARKGAILMSGP